MENKKPCESAEPLWRRFEVITDNKEQLKRAEDLLECKKIGRYDLALILATFCINPLMTEAHLQILLKGGAKMENKNQENLEAKIYEAFKKRTLDLIEKGSVIDPRMETEIRKNVRVICDLGGFGS